MDAPSKESLHALLAPWGQEHLLAFWEQIDAAARAHLTRQILALDFELLERLRREGKKAGDESDEKRKWADLAARAAGPPAIRLDDTGAEFSFAEARQAGEQALRAGRVGMMLVAGGLGTRLDFEHPKGLFPIGPLSGRTLFEVLIDQLKAVRRRYQCRIPLSIMTSPATDEETRQFFRDRNWLGLPASDVHIFCQATMWALDDKWDKILLESPGSLFAGPDGHGGMLSAFAQSGGLDDAQLRGLQYLFYGQIDNPLLQLCDPLLVGCHILAQSEMTTQVVQKRWAEERVGNVVSIDGQIHVIEYSDLPSEFARQTNPDGSLKLWAGNLAVHIFDVAFLSRMAALPEALPLHFAHKKVSCLDAAGRLIEPECPNAIRFERFIFDLLPHARNALVVEADAADAFAPVKNADTEPTDNPRLAKAAMIAQHSRWLRSAGANVAEGTSVEIHPLFALDAAEVAARIQPGTVIDSPTYFRLAKEE